MLEPTTEDTFESQDVEYNRKLRRQQKKVVKVARKKELILNEITKNIADNEVNDSYSLHLELSNYPQPKKLLILDLNYVLIYRAKFRKEFLFRPHVIDFLQDMLQRYTLAIWTSMQQKNARMILEKVFPRDRLPILFAYYQRDCTYEPPVDILVSDKPTFMKPLEKVWKKFPQYNASNTILLDDTKEKCVLNPVHTTVSPRPFSVQLPTPFTWYDDMFTLEEYKTIGSEIQCDDDELQREGPLWNHLDSIARHDGDVKSWYEEHGAYDFHQHDSSNDKNSDTAEVIVVEEEVEGETE